MFKDSLKNFSGGKILDVGTGVGDLVSCLVEGFKEYEEIIGIDMNEKAIETARKNYADKKINFVKMDANIMNFEDNSFDTVCISNTLHHLNKIDMVLVFREMKRVLKPNGLFIICEMYCDNQNEKQMTHVYFHHFGAEIQRINGEVHNETFKRQEIIDIVNELGVNIINTFDNVEIGQEDTLTEEDLNMYNESIDKRVELLKEHPEYERFKMQGENIKTRLYEIGIDGATELVVIGRK